MRAPTAPEPRRKRPSDARTKVVSLPLLNNSCTPNPVKRVTSSRTRSESADSVPYRMLPVTRGTDAFISTAIADACGNERFGVADGSHAAVIAANQRTAARHDARTGYGKGTTASTPPDRDFARATTSGG